MSEFLDLSAGSADDGMGREQLSSELFFYFVPYLFSAWCTEALPLALLVMIELR